MITGLVVCGSGDWIAQTIIERKKKLDVQRLLNFMVFGFIIGGVYHPWYKYLDRTFGAKMTFSTSWKKVCADQFILTPPEIIIFLAWDHYGTQKSYSFRDKLSECLPELLVHNYELWLPAQLINFWLFPEQHRVLFMCLVNVVWFSYLSYRSNTSETLKNKV